MDGRHFPGNGTSPRIVTFDRDFLEDVAMRGLTRNTLTRNTERVFNDWGD